MSTEIVFLYYVLGTMFLSAKIGFKPDGLAKFIYEESRDLDRYATALGVVLAFQFCVIVWPLALVTTVFKYLRNK